MRIMRVLVSLLAEFEDGAELSSGLQDADRVDVFSEFDWKNVHLKYFYESSALVYHLWCSIITSKISFMLRFWDFLLWSFSVFGGKAFAHVEVVRLYAALHRDFFWLVF